MSSLTALILAAGLGTRMKSSKVKALHEVLGKPMVEHVVDLAVKVTGGKPYVVVGHQAEEVKKALGDRAFYVMQTEQKGTGHAVMQAEASLAGRCDEVMVLYCDAPLLTEETLEALAAARREHQAGCSVLTVDVPDSTGYGRIVRDKAMPERISKIVEHKDASQEERAIKEINSGIYCFDAQRLWSALKDVSTSNRQKEYYLTDVVEILNRRGIHSVAVKAGDFTEGVGINDRKALAEASAIMRARILDQLMLSGVTIEDPETTYIDADVRIGQDTIIRPFTFIRGKTTIGKDCIIGPDSTVADSRIADNVVITRSVVERSVVERDVEIGPYSHLRPDSLIRETAKVGNYAEIKNSIVGYGSKVPHHSYVGDTEIGKHVNFSAGAITVNYDGKHKFKTIIGDNAFIGCNCNLVAPVTIGDGSLVAAGSTITDEVPADALAIARERQSNKEGWAKRKREAWAKEGGSSHGK